MKIKIISTGRIEDRPATYAVRMIEQGQAVKAEVKAEVKTEVKAEVKAAPKKEAVSDVAAEPEHKGKK